MLPHAPDYLRADVTNLSAAPWRPSIELFELQIDGPQPVPGSHSLHNLPRRRYATVIPSPSVEAQTLAQWSGKKRGPAVKTRDSVVGIALKVLHRDICSGRMATPDKAADAAEQANRGSMRARAKENQKPRDDNAQSYIRDLEQSCLPSVKLQYKKRGLMGIPFKPERTLA